jgi:hypothetical protein
MKLLTVNFARSVWLFNTGDLNPHGLALNPILENIQRRYRFMVFPKPEVRSPPEDLEFKNGTFALNGQHIEISKFTVYGDGLVAETRHSSAATDKFLEDLLGFAVSDYHLAFDPQAIKRKAYVSELIISTDVRIHELTEKIAKFSKLLSEQTDGDVKHEFHNTGFRLSTDPALQIAVMFIFERQAGVPFDQRRYFSQAPFTTERHLQLLDSLESIVTG